MFNVEACRERDGAAAEDRSERVADLLDADRLGHGEGDPLAAARYKDYPDRPEDLSAVVWQDWVERLLSHPLVDGWDAAVREATPTANDPAVRNDWKEAFQNAATLAGLDTEDLFSDGADETTDTDALAELMEAWPEDVLRAENPLVVATLYGGFGLSDEETARLLGCSEGHVRTTLQRCGLLNGTGANDGRDRGPQSVEAEDVRLGGVTMDMSDDVPERRERGGLTVRANDFE